MKDLTVIIPFLNEGDEIANTLSSIRSTAGDSIDILLINDCSTDNIDYEAYALQFNAQYFKNKDRLGVAASRDLGVSMISTPYFLLLDGHMRFYDSNWVARIIEELKSDEKILLCCQTKFLIKKENQLEINHTKTYGAYINLFDTEGLLTATWNIFEVNPNSTAEDIPCVLGAAYACNKEYWQYLNGLSGLMYYGSDEAYISLKVWLNGGKCRLLKDVVVGHIYRRKFPYQVENTHILYNNLLIAKLLLPSHLCDNVFEQVAKRMGDAFISANRIINEKEKEILELKKTYKLILNEDYENFHSWNEKIHQQHNKVELQGIVDVLIRKSTQKNDIGLLYGKMGIVLFFAHYAKYESQKNHDEFVETLLDEIFDLLGKNSPIDFHTGLCGIGWAIEYLIQNGLMEGNTDEILEDIDKIIANLDVEQIDDPSLEVGLCGVLHYVYARIISAHIHKRRVPFQRIFLEQLLQKAIILLSKIQGYEYADIITHYIAYINDGIILIKTVQLKHIFTLPLSLDNRFEEKPLGLRFGYAGVGLHKMGIR